MTDTTVNNDAVQQLLALGAALSREKRVTSDSTPYVVIPEDFKVEDLEDTLALPMRKRGTVTAGDEDSFLKLVNRHKVAAATLIYASLQPPSFTAVINDHTGDAPGWRDHKIVWPCALSVEWQTWTGANKKPLRQAEFAQFIEDNLPDIIEPVGADMLEISRTLEAKKKVNFASGIRLANGQTELTYEENIQGTAAKGKLQIPETFKLGIPVFEGGQRYAVTARLRYRIADANLLMWFDLERPHKVLEDAVQQVRASIAEKTGIAIVLGSI